MDLRHPPVLVLVVLFPQKQIAKQIADPPEDILDAEDGVVALAPVLAIGCPCLLVEFLLVLRRDQALAENQPADDTNGEGAATEAEAEEAIGVVVIIAAGELVDVDDVALQAEAEGAAEDGPWLE